MKISNLILLVIVILFASSCIDNFFNEVTVKENGSEMPKVHKSLNEAIIINVANESELLKYKQNLSRAGGGHFVKDTIINGKPALIYENNDIAITSEFESYAFPGCLLRGNTVEQMKPSTITAKVEPVYVSYSLIADNVIDYIEVPSKRAARQSCINILKGNGMTGEQISSFTYSMNEITYYDEVKFSFGTNVSVGSLFNLGISASENKIKSKSALTAQFIQENFTQDMDLPLDGCLLANNDELVNLQNMSPIYVNSIVYGRSGILLVESDYSYSLTKAAFNAALKIGTVGGSADLSSEHKEIINAAKINAYLLGVDGKHAAAVIEGFEKFKELITSGGKYSATQPGVPIYFRAAYLVDNSPFYTKYIIKIA